MFVVVDLRIQSWGTQLRCDNAIRMSQSSTVVIVALLSLCESHAVALG